VTSTGRCATIDPPARTGLAAPDTDLQVLQKNETIGIL